MGSAEVSSRRFWESIPARPPTPPREANHEPEPMPKEVVLGQALDPRSSLHTPPNVYPSDSSTTDSTNPSSRRGPKKVGFSGQAEYKEPPSYSDAVELAVRPTPPSAPSSGQPKPVKGILKPSYSPNPLDPLLGPNSNGVTESVNIAAMLESTIQQLAGADRDSKLDAYMMLVRALRISDNLPDRIALQDKMGLFTQFMQRDITSTTPTGTPDSSLAKHALTLLSTFFYYYSAVASTMSNEFDMFIVDHSIKSFKDLNTAKDVVRHLMQALSVQNFPPKVMTSDRVGKLVKALHELEGHVTGKSIIMLRIQTYRRLVRQAKTHMVTHLDWLPDLFTDMLSSVKEIRLAAIEFGLEAARAFGREKQVSRRVAEIFSKLSEETRYIECYLDRLKTMVTERQDSAAVPRIWSVVTLFLRSPFPLERWEFFSPWLLLLQSCFNSSDMPTKQEANYAWNRFVYVLHSEESSFIKFLTTLCQPLDSLLKRKSHGKQAAEFRSVVIGSICNLYYYAFKPSVNPIRLDIYWDTGVKPLMIQLATADRGLEAQGDQISQACAILVGLFDSSTTRLWREDRVMDNPLAEPTELPAIDSKWLRRNSSRIFAVIEPIFERAILDLGTKRSSVHKLWTTLVCSVASAASKEIKVSLDTSTFVAHMFGLLFKLWARGVPASRQEEEDSAARFLCSIQEYIQVVVDALGLLPFTEKMITMSKQNTFAPVATPSHRPTKSSGITRTPLQHLFSILSTLPSGVADDTEFYLFLRNVFKPFFSARTVQASSDLAQEMLRSLPMQTLLPSGPWALVRDYVHEYLIKHPQTPSSATSGSSEAPIGHELREVVKILERGLLSTPNLPSTCWSGLFADLCARAGEEAGDAGQAIAVIEPLAKAMLDQVNTREQGQISMNMLAAAKAMFAVATQPRDRQAVEAARRRLWGASIPGPKSGPFDTFDNLYKLGNVLLESLYMDLQHDDVDDAVSPLLSEVAMFLRRCNSQAVSRTLSNLQDGIAPWIRDEKSQLSSRQKCAGAEAVKTLWDGVYIVLRSLERPENFQLDLIEKLLCAAFESKHRYVVNSVSTLWNGIFDSAENVVYPEKLKSVLLAIRPNVDIVLPGLEASSIESGAQQQSFVESQDDLELLNISSTKSDGRNALQLPSSSRQSSSPAPVNLLPPVKRKLEVHIPLQRATPRARHDDSQIQFAPVESSSPTDQPMESQLLTEHQKEVRDRQKGDAILFPELRSSPTTRPRSSSRKPAEPLAVTSPVPDAAPERQNETTPEPESYEDVFNSTPTPRRGQAISIEDHEMTDPPSSPPEPRRYPLLPEMKSRSGGSNSRLDIDWEITSSPISGSPVPSHQVVSNSEPPELSLTGEMSQAGQVKESKVEVDAAVEDSFQMEVVPSSIPFEPRLAASKDIQTVDVPSKRSRPSRRSSNARSPGELPTTPHKRPNPQVQGTPRSDQEVFVDAMTSPQPPTPAVRSRPADQCISEPASISFAVSDGDERSMLRLAAEIDSMKRDRPSREISRDAVQPDRDEEPILDCITVKTEMPQKVRRSSRHTRSSSPPIPSTDVDAQGMTASQRDEGRKKRKRAESKPVGRRRKRRSIDNEELEPVEDSQVMVTEDVSQAEEMCQKDSPTIEAETSKAIARDAEIPSSSVEEPSVESAARVSEQPLQSTSPSAPARSKDGNETDEELESQLASEQEAFSGSQSQQREDEPVITAIDDSMEVDTENHEAVPPSDPAEPTSEPEEALSGDKGPGPEVEEPGLQDILGSLKDGMDKLRSAALSRGDVYKIEEMFMDMKRELYEAERRGRK